MVRACVRPFGVTEKSGTGETGTVCYEQTDRKSGVGSGGNYTEFIIRGSLGTPRKSGTKHKSFANPVFVTFELFSF